MKKIIALVLLCLVCVSLVACGSADKSTRSALLGSWVCEGDGSVVQINDDNTGTVDFEDESISFTWKYDEATRLLLATIVGDSYTEALTYIEVNDTLYADGYLYTRVK